MTRLKNRGGGFVPPLLAIFTAICLSGAAHAASITLAGQVFKPGGKLSGVSADTVPAAFLYDVAIEATGTSTGEFLFSTGTGDIIANLITRGLNPGVAGELINISGKLPITFCNGHVIPIGYSAVPLSATTSAASLTVKAAVSFSIDKDGHVHASASGFSFNARDEHNHKIPYTGSCIITSGSFTVVPASADFDVATPTIDFPQGHFTWNQSIIRMNRGSSKTQLFIIKNDGPNTDTLTLVGLPPLPFPIPSTKKNPPPPKPNYTVKVYDGLTDVTSAVYTTATTGFEITGTGYPIPEMPSGGTRLIKAVVHAGANAPSPNSESGPGDIGFILKSAVPDATPGSGAINVDIR
jgi:hypothetical protein